MIMDNNTMDNSIDMNSSTANTTSAPPIAYPVGLSGFAAAMAILFVVLGVFGNGVTVAALVLQKKIRRHATTKFVISLAVTDFIYCAFNLPFTASRYINMDWIHGEALCQIYPFLFYGNVAVSILNLLMITINRYILICHTSIYEKVYKQPYLGILIAVCWILALIILLPPLLGMWGMMGLNPQTFSCTILEDADGKSPKKFIFVFGIGVPMITIIVCYILIWWQFRKSSQSVQSHDATMHSGKKGNHHSQEERKLTKMMVIIFTSFTLCFIPLMLTNVLLDDDQLPSLHVIASILAWASAVINPFIYAYMNKKYRRAYQELFSCFRCCRQMAPGSHGMSTSGSGTRMTDTQVSRQTSVDSTSRKKVSRQIS